MGERLAELLASCRVVDLSKKVEPGKVFGRQGRGPRKYHLTRFTYTPGEIMHVVEMETHISTHVESPLHFMGPAHGIRGKDISELPVESFFGPAVFVNLAGRPVNYEVRPEDVEAVGARPGDIILFGNSSQEGADLPFLGREVAEYLASLPARMVGIDDTVYPESPQVTGRHLDKYFLHDNLLSNEIPLIEGLANLDALTATRFVFFGVPPALNGCDAFPIRALALIEP